MLTSRYEGPNIYMIFCLVDLATKQYSWDYSYAGSGNSVSTGIYKVTKWYTPGTSNGGTNLYTTQACEVYKNGVLMGTTTPNTAFALGINTQAVNQQGTFIIKPV